MELTNKANMFDSLIKLNLKFVIHRDGKTLNRKQFFIDYSPLFDHSKGEPPIIASDHRTHYVKMIKTLKRKRSPTVLVSISVLKSMTQFLMIPRSTDNINV